MGDLVFGSVAGLVLGFGVLGLRKLCKEKFKSLDQEDQDFNNNDIENKREESRKIQNLLKEEASKIAEKEKQKNGLVITSARYGVFRSEKATREGSGDHIGDEKSWQNFYDRIDKD